jgi:hypothetical protein
LKAETVSVRKYAGRARTAALVAIYLNHPIWSRTEFPLISQLFSSHWQLSAEFLVHCVHCSLATVKDVRRSCERIFQSFLLLISFARLPDRSRYDSESASHTEAGSQYQLISRVPDAAIAWVYRFTHQHPMHPPLLLKRKIYKLVWFT